MSPRGGKERPDRAAVFDNYPIPNQEEILARLVGKKWFTVMDAASFFYQLPVWRPHRGRMVIVSHRGLEESSVALMGFMNSPPHGQRFMDKILKHHRAYALAYIDDVIVFSDTPEDHLGQLTRILNLFEEVNLGINPRKSFFGFPSVQTLGFKVDGLEISTSPDRVEAIAKLKMPTTLDTLEQYIGMTRFLRKFVPWYQQKVQPPEDRKGRCSRLEKKTAQSQ